MTMLWHDENAFISVTVHEDAAVEIIDKTHDTVWRMGRVALQEDNPIDVGHVWLRSTRSICEQYPGRFQGEATGDRIRFTLRGREQRIVGAFDCQIRLDGPWLEFRLSNIDQRLPSLVFPTPIVSESLVVPMNIGRWIRAPLSERHVWVYPAHLNMRWFGGLRGDNGWIAVLHEGTPDAGVLATELTAAPVWLQSLGEWPGQRAVRYRFTHGGHVGLAKTFRGYAIEQGLHKSLREKISTTPAVENLHGGRLLALMQTDRCQLEHIEERMQPIPCPTPSGDLAVLVSHHAAQQVICTAHELGMRRGLVVLRGWINGGYDEQHPDIWPPEQALGSREALQKIVSDGPFPVALHDNYQDIYQQSPSWPHGVIRMPDGAPMPGGLWVGGQAYILNARDGLAYAKRNWPHIQTLTPPAMFIDTTTAVQFYQSYEAGNTLTRTQDMQLKEELLSFYKEQGLALGSEEVADFGVPWIDWFENRHRHHIGESLPLWPLVYHDAAFCVRYNQKAQQAYVPTDPVPYWLADLLWGYALIWDVRNMAHWHASNTKFPATLCVDEWHQRIGTDEMLDHRYLTDDGTVEQTTFTAGRITVNFSDEPQTVAGQTIAGGGYVIEEG